MLSMVEQIVSGGQTGVDLAALEVALAMGIPGGGWCPHGRENEAGPIDARYALTETPSADPVQRTQGNVRDSDGTLIIAEGELTGGTALTRRFAEDLGKPFLVVDPTDATGDSGRIGRWLAEHDIRVLNVAGPRESGRPGIQQCAADLLRSALAV